MGVLVAVGAGLCLWAVYLYLERSTSPEAAALITGLLALIGAGILAWTVRRITR